MLHTACSYKIMPNLKSQCHASYSSNATKVGRPTTCAFLTQYLCMASATISPQHLVPVEAQLERSLDRKPEVISLLRGERSELHVELVEVRRGDGLVELLREHDHPNLVLVLLGPQFNLESTWLVNEFDMTNDGWPVAHPRLTSRPSASKITWRPLAISYRSTCGLMFMTDLALALSQAESISQSKCPMLQTIASSFITSR